MNILDIVAPLLPVPVKKGFMPAEPDDCVAIFEYSAPPPVHSFGHTDILHGLQVRSRSLAADTAHKAALACAETLNRYQDGEISILQTTPVLDIGYDNANRARAEYTVNFTVRRL